MCCKIMFPEYGFSKKMLDVSTKSVSEKFRDFYRKLNIRYTVSSSYQHPSNVQEEACIKFVKQVMKKLYDINADVNLALLQMKSVLVGP